MRTYQGWIASLSNGETAFEQPPVPGEKSSWQKLLDRCTTEDIRITQMKLCRNGVTVICDFHKNVQGFCMAYEALMVIFGGSDRLMQGVGSIVADLVFMTWLDNDGVVRQNIRPLSEMRIHSTLRDVYDDHGDT